MAIKPSSQATGRATKALKEQSSVRKKLLGKAKAKYEALNSSEMSSWRYKDPATGKTHAYQSSGIYNAQGPGDRQRDTDKYVTTKRRTTSKMKKKT